MYENGRGDENKQLGTLENMNHLFDEDVNLLLEQFFSCDPLTLDPDIFFSQQVKSTEDFRLRTIPLKENQVNKKNEDSIAINSRCESFDTGQHSVISFKRTSHFFSANEWDGLNRTLGNIPSIQRKDYPFESVEKVNSQNHVKMPNMKNPVKIGIKPPMQNVRAVKRLVYSSTNLNVYVIESSSKIPQY